MQESVNRALPHRGITKKVIVLGKDITDASSCVVFSFDIMTISGKLKDLVYVYLTELLFIAVIKDL